MNLTTLVVGPLLGAVIGLVTNYVAIVMLFRPYKQWKLFGIPIPFTPGVIPRRHKELAKSIGNAVGEYIITETELRRTLLDPAVTGQVESLAQHQLEQISSYPGTPRQWLEDRHWAYQSYQQQATAWMTKLIVARLRDPATQTALLGSLRQELDRLLAEQPDPEQLTVVVTGAVEAGTHWLDQSITAPDNVPWLHQQINEGLVRVGQSERTLAEILGEGTVRSLVEVIHSQGPNLARLVGDALLDKAIRQKILDALLQLISSQWLLRALGSALPPQRLDQLLQKVLAEAALYLEREENQAVLVSKAESFLYDLLNRPLGELIRSTGEERVKEVAYSLVTHGVGLLHYPGLANKVGEIVGREMQMVGEQSWGDLAGHVGLNDLADHVIGRLQHVLGQWSESPRLAEAIEGAVRGELERLLDRPVQQWLAQLDSTRTEKWIHESTTKGMEMVAHQAPAILRLLDVKQMVTRKVEEYPLPEAQRIILEIAGKELAYITYFGGLLGLIIGLVQPLLSLIH